MKTKNHLAKMLFSMLIATIVFTIFRRIMLFTNLVAMMVSANWSLLAIQVAAAALEFLSGGIVVILVMPPLLGRELSTAGLSIYLSADIKALLLGSLSFALFALLGAGLAKLLGIYIGDVSVILAKPDIAPDPDIVGYGYFILALVPGVWEELAFRGVILSRLEQKMRPWPAILWSAAFFALFHLSNLVTQPPSAALGGVIMALCFGLVWGLMKVKTGSVIPAMLSHYLIDAVGMVFLNVDASDPARSAMFFILLVISFTVVNILLILVLYPSKKAELAIKSGLLEKEGL